MKTTVNNILLTLLSLLFVTSCTLSMDEWTETEEDKGYDEVETVENDLMQLEYKYKENTRSLTEGIQEYIVQVEADSIIYFTDNIPSDWLPKVGGHVVANCCELFPMGLIARVLSVEPANGMLKVTVTKAEIEDAYEEFNLYIDTQIWTNNDEEEADTINLDDNPATSREVITRAGAGKHKVRQVITRSAPQEDGTNEVIIRDWSMYRASMGSENTYKGRHITRATELDEVYDQDVKLDETKESEIIIAQVNIDDKWGKALVEKAGNFINTVDVKFAHVTRTKMKKIVELKKKREYTRTRTDNGYKLEVCVGHDFTKRKKGESEEVEKGRIEKLTEMIKNSSRFKNFQESLAASKSRGKLDVDGKLVFLLEIPLGSSPVGLLIRLKPVLDVKLGLFGVGNITFWTSSDQVTTEVVNGKKVRDEKLTDKKKKNGKRDITPPANEYNVSLFGTFAASLGAEVFIGFGKKVSLTDALGIGAFAEATINTELNISGTIAGDNRVGSANDFFKLYGKLKVGGKILTAGLFGDVNFLSVEWTKDAITAAYFPTVQFKGESTAIVEEDDKGKYEKQDIIYTFPNLGMHATGVWYRINEPILAVFKKDTKDMSQPDEILREPTFENSNKWNIKTKKEYTFTNKNYDLGKEFYVVPGVQNLGGKNRELYPQYKKTVLSLRKPNIEYKITDMGEAAYDHIYQSLGDDWGVGGGVYEFAMPFTLRNGHTVSEYWDDWGVHFIIRIDNKTQIRKMVSLKDRITKSGKYMPKLKFYSEVNAENHNIFVEEPCIYYKLKDGETYFHINNSWDGRSTEYSYKKYKMEKNQEGDILLNKSYQMTHGWEDNMSDFSDFKSVKVTAK